VAQEPQGDGFLEKLCNFASFALVAPTVQLANGLLFSHRYPFESSAPSAEFSDADDEDRGK
jgi:hypothetical protein